MSETEETGSGYETDEAVPEREKGEIAEETPSISDIIRDGAPPEYIPILVLSFCFCLFTIVLFVRAVIHHKKNFTKHTMQGLCTLGIIFTFPVYTIMYYSGIIVPKAMAKVTFLAESYEAISLVFFLRLLFTYMGGKKKTVAALKGKQVTLANPPLCCLICLPHINFTKKYMLVHEWFILQLFIYQIVMGYIDLLIGIDDSHAHPAALIEQTYSHYFHGFSLLSLLLAIYGLGGIYHAAEQQLKHYQIFRKFILYKVFVTVAKIQELVVSLLLKTVADKYDVELGVGAISGHLRAHMWVYCLVIAEAAVIFPFLLRAYSTADYPEFEHEDGIPLVEITEDSVKREIKSDYVSFPEAQTLESGDSVAGSEGSGVNRDVADRTVDTV